MRIRRKWPHEPVVGCVTSQAQPSGRERGGYPSCFRHSSRCPGHVGAHSAPHLGFPCPTGQHAGELRRRLLHGWPGQDPPPGGWGAAVGRGTTDPASPAGGAGAEELAAGSTQDQTGGEHAACPRSRPVLTWRRDHLCVPRRRCSTQSRWTDTNLE